jgi:hypothetical protein
VKFLGPLFEVLGLFLEALDLFWWPGIWPGTWPGAGAWGGGGIPISLCVFLCLLDVEVVMLMLSAGAVFN